MSETWRVPVRCQFSVLGFGFPQNLSRVRLALFFCEEKKIKWKGTKTLCRKPSPLLSCLYWG